MSISLEQTPKQARSKGHSHPTINNHAKVAINHRAKVSHDQAYDQSRPMPRTANRLQHIMIISSQVELAETLQIELSQAGYQVSVIHDGLRGLLAIKRTSPDLIVIGWAPPRLSGLELCDRLRLNQGREPVILLTQNDNAEDRIAGLEAGANDCISMPFVKAEFIARIHANLAKRRSRSDQDSILRCADILLNRKTREVFRGDRFIRLTAKEFDLLEYLMDHYFQVLTRAQILENVWGYDYLGSSNIIEVYIRYLRRKLEDGSKNRVIQTVRSVGYILRETP